MSCYVLSILFFCTIFLSAPCPAYSENPNILAAQAAGEYDSGNFGEAAAIFELAAGLDPNNYKFNIGLGNSKYRLNDFSAAERAFRRAASLPLDAQSQANALYNLGNSLVQLNRLEEAIRNYEESLKIVPDQKHVENNLEYAKKLLEEQKQEKDSLGQDQESQKENRQDSDQQDNNQQETSENQNQQQSGQNENEQDNSDEKNNGSDKPDENNLGNGTCLGEVCSPKQENQNSSNEPDPHPAQQAPSGTNNKDNESEQSAIAGETLLNALTEDRGTQKEFRRAEALQQIETSGGKLPLRDW